MRSEMSLLFNSRSDINGASTGVCGPLRDTERLDKVVFEGEGGGGIAIALGIRARGVLLKEGRDFEGVVDVGMPILSMHSIRETAGSHDFQTLIDVFGSFFTKFSALDKQLSVD